MIVHVENISMRCIPRTMMFLIQFNYELPLRIAIFNTKFIDFNYFDKLRRGNMKHKTNNKQSK